MKLYPYQVRAVANVRAAWSTTDAVCLIAPTGAGKTVMARELANGFRNPVMLVPRLALRDQSEKTFKTCTIQSLLNPAKPCPFGEPDLVIWDEAHHSASERWAVIRKRWPNAKWLGLTATPVRADDRPLDLFGAWVEAAKYSELVEAGVIVPCHVYSPKKDVRSRVDADPVTQFNALVPAGVKAVAFCADIAQCEDVADGVNAIRLGERAAAYHSKVSEGRRKKLMSRFREAGSGLDLLVTHDMLTEGFDMPELGVLILARPCHEVGTYLQVAGRGARACPGKPAFHLIDCAGASLRHGNPIRDWTFDIKAGIVTPAGDPNVGVGGGGTHTPRVLDASVQVQAPPRAAIDLEAHRRALKAALDAKAKALVASGADAKVVARLKAEVLEAEGLR